MIITHKVIKVYLSMILKFLKANQVHLYCLQWIWKKGLFGNKFSNKKVQSHVHYKTNSIKLFAASPLKHLEGISQEKSKIYIF